ncbi:hypothetical protein MNBD_PLANCTO02-2161 [hydrothermal vent metagenome]|uniref:Two-component transcriptional response regulator, LuxR family n=1 Tax=hydrothermal vent metagenome TaxID=652676 RepID=A0A3B1E7E9_9ZZZZ
MRANKCHILLVDDNPDDRELVLRELRKELENVSTQVVIDANEWKKALEQGEFDLVITDYQLRWTDGITVLKELKERYIFCPVIMFTGSGNEEVAVEAMKLGLDDYIVKKPSHLVRLRGAVASVLRHTQVQRKAAFLENRFRSLLQRLDVGVFRVTLGGDYIDVNQAMYNLLEVANLNAFLPPLGSVLKGGGELWQQLVNSLQNCSNTLSTEVQLISANGGFSWCNLNIVLKVTADGTEVIDGLLTDISARKRAEGKRIQRVIAETKLSVLSPREQEVFHDVVDGKQNKMIAARLDLSEKTIEKHRANMMKKLELRSVAALVKLSVEAEKL